MATIPYVHPVPGAARYWASRCDVWMEDTDTGKYTSCIQSCRTEEAAIKAAVKWQKRENAAVTKEAKRLASLPKV